ncbi:hypothetical protein WR25_18777 [Diploscapter pachys]|uniref:Uncharacterized protein n=1 Tax=Diploscapter pachys TaxID=2018661 RepID=A0A2A2JQC8_9BILA|nr:hypothetical protein WR25_18777 [Diploscapter pachys]
MIERLNRRRNWLDSRSRACDECAARRPFSALRRCKTCEIQMGAFSSGNIDCIVCLECCVESHNGHQMVRINGDGRKVPRGLDESDSFLQIQPLSPPPSIHSETSSTSAQSRLAALSLAGAFSPPLNETGNSSPNTTFHDNTNEESLLLFEEETRKEMGSPIYVNTLHRKNKENRPNSTINDESLLSFAPKRRPSMGVGARKVMRRKTIGQAESLYINDNLTRPIVIDAFPFCSPNSTRINEFLKNTQKFSSQRFEKSRKPDLSSKWNFLAKYEQQKRAVVTKLNSTYEYI